MKNLVKNEKDLLASYVKDRNQEAFAGLVEHYQGLVFAAARRQVHDASLAEDVSQAVFLLLASKARSVKPAALTAWLLQTTRLSALAMLRQEAHQRHCDQQAVEEPAAAISDSSWMELQPHLDEALCALPEKDRATLLMRFFEELPDQLIGERLGMSGKTVNKRINRALDKLRNLFEKRGLHLSGTALTGLLSTQLAEAAPLGLASGVIQAHAVAVSGGLFAGGLGAVLGTSSLSSLGPSVPSGVLTLFSGVKKMMILSTIKYCLAIGVLVVASVTGAAVLVASQQEAPPQKPAAPASAKVELTTEHGLQLRLSANMTETTPKGEVEFVITYVNREKEPLKYLAHMLFAPELTVMGPDGTRIAEVEAPNAPSPSMTAPDFACVKELAPGEQREISRKRMSWTVLDPPVEDFWTKKMVHGYGWDIRQPGRYTVIATYDPSSTYYGKDFNAKHQSNAWVGKVESNTLTLTVKTAPLTGER